jgi:uncharacterized membrane protein HdeD (DUF308 family)
VIGAIAGILALVYPDITLLALALIAGINLMLMGVLALIEAFGGERDATARLLCGIIGILGLIGGLVVIRRPGESLLAILLVLGIWLIVSGIVDFIRAFARLEGRALMLLSALVDVILGVLILALPKLSLATLAILVGISFIVRGVFSVVRGIAIRRGADKVADVAEEAASPPVTA